MKLVYQHTEDLPKSGHPTSFKKKNFERLKKMLLRIVLVLVDENEKKRIECYSINYPL